MTVPNILAQPLQKVVYMKDSNTNIHQKNLNILVINDDATLLSSISFCLKATHHRVSIARTNPKAFIQIKERVENNNPFDLLILDITLPKGQPTSFLKSLNTINIHTPIIVMSNYDTSNQRKELSQLGAQYFLSKPFSKEELLKIVGEIQNKSNTSPIAKC